MFYLSKYAYMEYIKKIPYLLNLNNGALIQIDEKIATNLKKDKIKASDFSKNELSILKKFNFIVDKNFDRNQSSINKMTYTISKYNQLKDHLKIDFAVTNKCNFNCPYCFEKEELNNCKKEAKNTLVKTSENLLKYLNLQIKNGLKSLEIVFYGGEPTLELNFISSFINKVIELCNRNSVNFDYIFITNGFLLDESEILKMDCDHCRFIQITLDGEKDFHNTRRTNSAKINTFDTLINNINYLLDNKFHVVVRLNVDKTNYISIENLLKSFKILIKQDYFGSLFTVDIARVFGTKVSFDLKEYENYREKLFDIASDYNLIQPNLNCKNLTAFCIAETMTKDLVVDHQGFLYRCWNNVFNSDYKIGSLSDLLKKNCDIFETSPSTIEFINELSLDNVNNGKCYECEFCKYCQGLCPSVRKSIIEGKEKNIYLNNECKNNIKQRLRQLVRRLVNND